MLEGGWGEGIQNRREFEGVEGKEAAGLRGAKVLPNLLELKGSEVFVGGHKVGRNRAAVRQCQR